MRNKVYDIFPFYIVLLAILAFGRVMLVDDVIWDDNCWLLSIFATDDLDGFLSTGFYELRRAPMGVFYYFYYLIFKFTDSAYLIWNLITMLLQAVTPLFLYYLVRNLVGRRLPAFFVAASFILCPVDSTVPFYAATAHRTGALLCVISFYMTERAFSGGVRHFHLFIALTASAFSAYVLVEAAIMLEPARLLLIWHLLSRVESGRDGQFRKALALWAPFALFCIPLVYYKLTYKQYGIYGGIYKNDYLFFLDMKKSVKMMRYFLFYNWSVFLKLIKVATIWSAVLGVLAFLAGLSISGRIASGFPKGVSVFRKAWAENWKNVRFIFILGLALMVPAMMMYEFANRIPARGMEGRHAVIMLFGFSMMTGTLIYSLHGAIVSISKRRLAGILLALFIGTGVFFHNVNFDIFKWNREHQRNFWKEFTARFPVLPEKAVFFIDARGEGMLYHYADLEASYELEYPLNMLYARSASPGEFRNYIVYAESEGIREEWKTPDKPVFERASHWGTDVIDPDEMIVVRYREGDGLLVNREILKIHPDIPYKMLADKEPPEFRGPVPHYLLRHRLRDFY